MNSSQPFASLHDQHALDCIKLESLRKDIQVGLEQIERGEIVVDFEENEFLHQMKSRVSSPQAPLQ
jgi:hypothetical protein